jgi:hypothetical protein
MPVIEARKKRFRAQEYTSARLKTQGLHDWTYGYHDRPNGRSYHIWPQNNRRLARAARLPLIDSGK